MANTTIKITQLPNIGNGLAANTLLPVVNTAGTAVTEKVTVGNVANFILTEAGNTLPTAFVSQIAYSVSNAAQPNITSVGNLNINTLHITGGENGQYLQTNGAGGLSWVAGGGSGNGVVGGSVGQIQFNNNGLFGGDPELTWDAGNNQLNTVNFAAEDITIYGNVNTINVNATGNLVPNAIYTDNYFYANGYPFSGGGGNGGGVPGGSNTQIQFNDNGTFGGNTGFTFNKTTGILSSPFLAGNGNGISNIQGANVSGTVASATVAGSANSVAGANVSGQVSYANIANAVAVANVVGLGNIATVTLNGSSSQVLYGNGQWGDTSTANTGNITFSNTTIGTANYSDTINIVTRTAHGDDNQIQLLNKSVNIYAFDTDANSFAQIVVDDNNITAPNVAINLRTQGVDKDWTFDSTGNLIFPQNGTGTAPVRSQRFGMGNLVAYLDGTWAIGEHNGTDFGTQGIRLDPGIEGGAGIEVPSVINSATAAVTTYNYQGGGVNVVASGNTWHFASNGNIVFPDTTQQSTAWTGTVSAANVTGLGNIATVNLDGNIANVLAGDGSWLPMGGAGNASLPLYNGTSQFAIPVADGNVEITSNSAHTWTFDVNGGLNLPNFGVVRNAGDVNIVATNYAQLQWVDSGNINLPNPNNTLGPTNWLYVDGTGAFIETNMNNGGNTHSWSFDGAGNTIIPGNIISHNNGFGFTSNVIGITTGNPTVVVTLQDNVFGGPTNGQVNINFVVGTTQANGTWWYQAVEVNQFQLYTNNTFTTPVDGTAWSAYVSGGIAVANGWDPILVKAGTVAIEANDNGNISSTWSFEPNGSFNIPDNSGAWYKGRIQSHNGYPTLMAYGSGGHGGPEFDWMDSDNPTDFINSNVLRNSMYFNHNGLYIGINENTKVGNYKGNWTFDNQGNFIKPNYVYENTSATTQCNPGGPTVVFSSINSNIHTMKLIIQVEGRETSLSWDTQACEMLVARSFRNNNVIGSVYGLTYTSNNPLATFNAAYNATTNQIDITCTPTSAQEPVFVRVSVTQITTAD